MPDIPLLFVPPKYLFDESLVNDTPDGTLDYVPDFWNPWFNPVKGEDLNVMVRAINELIARLNLQYAQREITAAGNVTLANGEYLILMNKAVGAATQITLPPIEAYVDEGYNFTNITIKDFKGDSYANPITITGDVPINGGNGSGNLILKGNYGSVSLRAKADKLRWLYV